jgi:hypothetical protein
MNDNAKVNPGLPNYPRGFRRRRGLNWGVIGLLYTSFYMCRYNLSIANLQRNAPQHLYNTHVDYFNGIHL